MKKNLLFLILLLTGIGASSQETDNTTGVTIEGNTTVLGELTANAFIGDGSELTNLPTSISLTDLGITATTTELNLLSGITSLGTGILSPVTENGNTGVRLSTAITNNYGNIGSNAVDLSYSNGSSETKGASGNYSVAMGLETQASGANSTTTGSGTIASGAISTAMGFGTTASGISSMATGYGTDASGTSSTAMGRDTIASDYSSLVIGHCNLEGSTPETWYMFDSNNTAFVIGNGTSVNDRSDAFLVKFSGDATLAGELVQNSDMRLKANIISLGNTLAKLLKIDGKSYTLKKDQNQKQRIGVLAQDIEKVFPELVSESNGIKSVNYQGLVPVLINALKEQQNDIEDLKKMVLQLMSDNEK